MSKRSHVNVNKEGGMKPVEIALEYASNNWPVFPCRPRHETVVNHAGKPEEKKPKSPLTRFGFREATKTTRIIERWWQDNPDALIGVPTGAPSGFWVLDIDVPPEHEDGRIWLAEMEAIHDTLPPTRMARTASGGVHYYWRHVAGVRNSAAIAPGVDTRGDGGFVCVPGSVLEDGTFYEWINDLPIADAPDWLLPLVLQRRSESHQEYPPAQHVDRVAGASEVEDLLSYVSPDCGYQDWVNVLMAVHSALGQEGLQIADAWSSKSKKYRVGEVASKWRGFKDAGGVGIGSLCDLARQGGADLSAISRKHNDDFQHDNTRLVDITKMIANGIAKGKARKTESATYESVSEDHYNIESDISQATEDAPAAAGDGATIDHNAAAEAPAANDNTPQSPINATAFKWIDPSTLPRREFVFGTHFIRKYVSVTVSPGGLGKTSLSIAEALSMASGKYIFREKHAPRFKVWIFNAEDPRDELERRIMAACIHYNLKPKDIEGHLFLDSGREQELVVAVDDKKTGVRIQQPIVEAVVEQILANEIDVMIVDPFVSTHGVNENDNGAIDKVAKLWAQIADKTNCSIDIVHHLRKVADREATVEDARGAVSLIGAARSVRVLNRMSEDQSSAAGIEPASRHGYFSVTYGKSNLTPLSSKLDWRKLESVALGNGRGLATPQDYAPVVVEWKWPSAEDAVGEVPAEKLAEILMRVRNTDCKLHHQAENWVGREVAYVLGLDISIRPDAARVKRLVKAWIEDGTFVVVNRRCPIKRENKDFVEVA